MKHSAIRPPARRRKSQAMESKVRLRGSDQAIPDYVLKNHHHRAGFHKGRTAFVL
jgi:hypothetical protein